MIVPMKKIFLLLLESERTEALDALRDSGVVHLEDISGSSTLLEELAVKRDTVYRSISLLGGFQVKNSSVKDSSETALEIAKRVVMQHEKSKTLEEEMRQLEKEREQFAVWGDFEPGDIHELDGKGIHIKLCEITEADKKNIPDAVAIFPVAVKKKLTYAALIVPEGLQLPELKEVTLPDRSMKELETLMQEKLRKKQSIDSELETLAAALPRLKLLLEELDEEIEFESVRCSANSEGPVVYLSGYVPVPAVDTIKRAAKQNGWGLLIKDPEEDDNVPTLIENPKAVRIIKPVFDILNIIPGYKERDISLFFLLFLSIFFAMIVGDAGYGAIFLGVSLYFGLKGKKKTGRISDMIFFMIVMSSCTILWGAVTGTWFGSITLAKLPFFKALTIDKIASFGKADTSSLIKHICFILGTVQISIAHIWNFIEDLKKKPVIRAFAQLGWLSMVNGLYFLILNFVLSSVKYPVPTFAVYMIFGGFAAVLLFSEQEGNIFKGILKGFSSLMTIFLSSIGAFSDIISYIRLFAVGLATLAVASSFNAMAAGMGHGVVGIVGSVIILLLGHGLNLAMGSLAIIVHGVRLNLLEFSGHLGMEWVGINYSPFRNRKKEKEGEK